MGAGARAGRGEFLSCTGAVGEAWCLPGLAALNAGAWSPGAPSQPRARFLYLGVGVLNTVIHKHHDKDGDGHPEVTILRRTCGQAHAQEAHTPPSRPDCKLPPFLPRPGALYASLGPASHPSGEKTAFAQICAGSVRRRCTAMRTSDSRAVLGWPGGLPCPGRPGWALVPWPQ